MNLPHDTQRNFRLHESKSDNLGLWLDRFADPAKIKGGRIGGRRAFSKAFKEALIDRYGSADTISSERLDPRYLQIDHRIPYEGQAGFLRQVDSDTMVPEELFLDMLQLGKD